jgi:hypothetical protein
VSFKLFIYYSTICGAWAALAAAGVSRVVTQLGGPFAGSAGPLAQNILMGSLLGLFVALVLGIVDGLWNLTGYRYNRVMARGSLSGLLGALGAAAGAGIGSMLLNWIPSAIAVVAGWMLTGLMIGASLGSFDYLARLRSGDRSGGGRRKLINALMGGSLGGAAGGALFVGAGNILPALFGNRSAEELVSPTSWGFAALGSCLGLFIGTAQIILRTAWIRIETGRRFGRELILSKDETTIGRTEACDLGLFGDPGVERMHARIILKDGRYLLSDAGTDGGTFLNDRRLTGSAELESGDSIRVGTSLLSFRVKRKKSVRNLRSKVRS